MTIDFRDAKRHIDLVLPDHKYLNDVYDFNPTAENIAKHLYNELKYGEGFPVVEVTLWESKDAGARYP